MAWLNYNGKIYREDELIMTANNRGLRYGDGLFETMRLKNSQLVFANEHFARLWKGMHVLQFAIPKHFTPENLEKEILQLALKNQHQDNVRTRLTIFRGKGGLYDAADHSPNYIIETWPLPASNDELNSNGLDIGIYTAVKKSCDILSNLKTNNFLPYVMAALEAKKQKWNDAVILNSNGRICDSSIANIFLIKNGIFYTPALSEGCVAGIIRKHIIIQLPLMGYSCIEKEISIEELLDADEVFLTNSIYNVRWVKNISDKTFGNTLTQKIWTGLHPTIL
jgi:branched-chain amino acid aminotransferase